MMSTEKVAMLMGATPEVARAIEDVCIKYGIENTLQKAHFLGQIYVESQGFSVFKENLNYSVDSLLKMFSRSRISEADARKYGRTASQRANQEMIANTLYGGIFGLKNLGNSKEGDGWRFIGRGIKQLTGRANYTLYSIDTYRDDRIVKNPQLLEQLPDAVLSAGWFWKKNGLNSLANTNSYEAVTRRINGGTNGLAQRTEATKRALVLFEQMKA